ncbi:MAG: aspartate/tyrosine/aromatic aminotransferase [Propionibacteriaceae bacterium]|jgi:aromatic-amino-acid transaminase|nr:aspartate/tyrosine/aromatic aminotransferase [Propionibacteriaceae bacterium]
MSHFAAVPLAPRDPILGVTEAFQQDPRPYKTNLGVGVYQNEQGQIPVLDCVRQVERAIGHDPRPHGYLPIDGFPLYIAAVKALVFGPDAGLVASGRVATLQALGGTGGLRLGAGVLAGFNPRPGVLVSNPSWENHEALFRRAGFRVGHYRYYDPNRHGVDVDGLVADLAAAAPGTIVVLHACCHNPTGYDLRPDDWARVVAVCADRQLMPFLDMAYQGFDRGLNEDAQAIAQFVAADLTFLVATSFSKSLSLYGERVGSINFVTGSADEAARVLSQAKVTARTIYSNPPSFGAKVAAQVLTDPDLRASWETELGQMRDRIKAVRRALRRGLEDRGLNGNFSYITQQTGMFSYSGLTPEQMHRLRDDYAVYGLDSGRLCMAAINHGNIDHVIEAIANVWE